MTVIVSLGPGSIPRVYAVNSHFDWKYFSKEMRCDKIGQLM
jgi:hypothetical protein